MFYRVTGQSMEPEYKNGSVVLISKNVVKYGLKRGDVIMAFDPRDGRRILKRVAEISARGIFLRGDDLSKSTDSRTFGLVQKENIIGKVIMRSPKRIKAWSEKAVPVLAIVGLVDAAYLTFKHFEGGEVECGVIPGANCNVVLGSMYSEIFGIPLALLGTLYYLTVFSLWITYVKNKEGILLRLLLGITSMGFLTSLYLVYIQAFVLNAYCVFCMTSALASTFLFVSLLIMTFSKKRNIISELDKHE